MKLSCIAFCVAIPLLPAGNREPDNVSTTQTLPIQHANPAFKIAANPDPNERIQLAGFSVAPPRGEYWIEGPRFPRAQSE